MGAGQREDAVVTVRRRQEQPSRLPFVLSILAAAAGVALLWVHFPGLPLTLVCLTVAGTVHPAPVLTGRQGAGVGRRPVPVTSAEKRALARHARLRRLRSLPLPLGQWPVQTSGVAGVGAALVAGSLQVSPTGWAPWLPSWGPWANGVAAFLLVSGLERVWRQTRGGSEPGPGTPVALLASASRCQLVVVLVSIVVGVGCGVATCASLRSWVSSPGLTCTGAALVGAAFGVWVTCRRRSWRPWRLRETARRQWERRWAMTPKEDQPPELVDRLVDGPLTVDVFRARPGRDLSYYVKARSQLAAAVGGGANVRVLPAPVVNGAGEPEPGTVDPALFQVAVLAAGADEEQVDDLGLAAAFQWAGRWDGVPKVEPAPVFVSRELVGPYTVDTFDSPGRPSAEMLRASDRLAVGVGAGLSAVVIPVQEEGLPGSIHPTRFRVAVCAPGTQVDVAEADEDVVRVRLECFLTQAADYLHQDVVALAGLELLTVDGPRVWLVELGDSLSASRLAGLMRQVAPALVDGREGPLGGDDLHRVRQVRHRAYCDPPVSHVRAEHGVGRVEGARGDGVEGVIIDRNRIGQGSHCGSLLLEIGSRVPVYRCWPQPVAVSCDGRRAPGGGSRAGGAGPREGIGGAGASSAPARLTRGATRARCGPAPRRGRGPGGSPATGTPSCRRPTGTCGRRARRPR